MLERRGAELSEADYAGDDECSTTLFNDVSRGENYYSSRRLIQRHEGEICQRKRMRRREVPIAASHFNERAPGQRPLFSPRKMFRCRRRFRGIYIRRDDARGGRSPLYGYGAF